MAQLKKKNSKKSYSTAIERICLGYKAVLEFEICCFIYIFVPLLLNLQGIKKDQARKLRIKKNETMRRYESCTVGSTPRGASTASLL